MNLSSKQAICRIVIVGGGYSGASAAIQLVRASAAPMAITIIEPREHVGPGLAYSADDADHRLNGPVPIHFIDPSDPGHFQRWCEQKQILTRDPEAQFPNGTVFVRRSDFGAYLAEVVRDHASLPETGSSIRHLRDRATGVATSAKSFSVHTAGGDSSQADLLIVATGNAHPRLPAPFNRDLASHPGVIAMPTDLARVRAIPADARVLVLGTALTALDIISTLLRSEHSGGITAVSRRGLRPRPQRPVPEIPVPTATLLERIAGPVPLFVQAIGNTPKLRALLRALRKRISEMEAAGENWYVPFDELRDVVWQVWPTLPAAEKRLFTRKLRSWYDVHRFRVPPQNDAMVREAEQRGRVTFRAARIQSAEAAGDRSPIRVSMWNRDTQTERIDSFDALINCTGLDAAAGASDNPFLAALIDQGLLQPDASGIGFAVDDQCRAISAEGISSDRLRVIGPPTAGTFGDPLGALFIAAHIRRIVPDVIAPLGADQGPKLDSSTSHAGTTPNLGRL